MRASACPCATGWRADASATRLTTPLVDALFAAHPGHQLSEIGHALLDSHQVVDVLAAGRIEDAARWVAALASR